MGILQDHKKMKNLCQKNIDFTLNEKDILTQSHELYELANERTIYSQAAPHNYIERLNPSSIIPRLKYDKSQSFFSQDPRAVLYKFYNKSTKYVSEDSQDYIRATDTLVSQIRQDETEIEETINEPYSKRWNDSESTDTDKDPNSSIKNHLSGIKNAEMCVPPLSKLNSKIIVSVFFENKFLININ